MPSLTPRSSIEKDFRGSGTKQSKRYKRPVVHANAAEPGGSCVYADTDRFDTPPDALPPGQEAILVVDIDMSQRKPGASTAYDARPAVRTFTRATLVYPSTESDYAEWLRAWYSRTERAASNGSDAGEGLSELAQWLNANPPPERARSTQLRRERLGKLLQDCGRWRSVREVEGLTLEVVLGGNTLAPRLLKAALAEGAGRQIDSWRDLLPTGSSPDSSAAIQVADRLREGAQRLIGEGTVSQTAKSAMARVGAAACGELPDDPISTEYRAFLVASIDRELSIAN